MTPNHRREAALKLLAATGLNRLNYEPPLVRLLWRMGFDVPPPHFASFFYGAVVSGAAFAVLWGLLMWFMTWRSQGVSIPWGIGMATFTGLLFGIAMAGYYSIGRRKYNLPDWNSIPSAAGGA